MLSRTSWWRYIDRLKVNLLRLSDNEYSDYVMNDRSMYSKRMKREISDEEHARWIFLLGEYYKGQCLSG
jgi:hypothetical protein